jgi:excisionase family DNA binding protein
LPREFDLAFSTSFNSERGPSMPAEKHEPSKLAYSIKEACRASSLGRTTIYNHISAGRLRAVRVGGRTIIPAEALHALIAGEA